MQVFLFNYWYNVDAPFASAIEDREYSHKEVDLLSCVVTMSYGGYYDAYPVWSQLQGTSIGGYYVASTMCGHYDK